MKWHKSTAVSLCLTRRYAHGERGSLGIDALTLMISNTGRREGELSSQTRDQVLRLSLVWMPHPDSSRTFCVSWLQGCRADLSSHNPRIHSQGETPAYHGPFRVSERDPDGSRRLRDSESWCSDRAGRVVRSRAILKMGRSQKDIRMPYDRFGSGRLAWVDSARWPYVIRFPSLIMNRQDKATT